MLHSVADSGGRRRGRRFFCYSTGVKVSIIIPAINEAGCIGRAVRCARQSGVREVIVVDGGSNDESMAIARKSGCRMVSGPRGRGRQMNLGVQKSTAELLLFLHADTVVPENFIQLITSTLARKDVAAGAFSLRINTRCTALQLVGWGATLRSRLLALPYGDQGIFTSREYFNQVEGFPEMEIMEDYVFIQRIKNLGKIVTLREQVTTSARRWENVGIVRTTLINQLIVIGYHLKLPPATLARFYQRARGIGQK